MGVERVIVRRCELEFREPSVFVGGVFLSVLGVVLSLTFWPAGYDAPKAELVDVRRGPSCCGG
eukprot:510625-Prorocentrum_lima.AAC.1